jgi:hypothetical protein
LALNGSEWLTLHPGHFNLGKEVWKRLGASQSQYVHLGEEKTLSPLAGFKHWTAQSISWSLYWLCYSGSELLSYKQCK